MKAPKAFWVGIICIIGGCTQLLELDQEYRPSQTSAGGGGTGGGSTCVMDADCPPAENCTTYTCVETKCVPENLPAGSPCTADNMLVCDENGICGECNESSDCTTLPPDDECQKRTCSNHVCGQTFTPADTALITQVKGDCLKVVCDGSGSAINQTDDTDLPEDNNPCTKNQCNAGEPSFPFEPLDTSCGVGLQCNATGQCVGCFAPTDCPGVDDFCKTRTCTNGMCGFNFTAMGTNLPMGQTAEDCKVVECDGQGNIIDSVDNADVPVDGNACTQDVCTAGVPSNPFEALNTPCGNGGSCSGTGVCRKANGSACMAGAECVSGNCIEGYCCDSTCGQTCKACNIPGSLGICINVPAGYTDDSCASPKSCDGTMGGNSCTTKFPMGYPCTGGTQCGSGICVDGACCSSTCTAACKSCNVAGSAGTCTNIPLGQEDGALCSGTNSCNGMGVCKKDNGAVCAAGTECLSAICADGVCCNATCTDTCKACNVAGSVGVCSNVPSGADDSPTCAGANSCNGNGICKKDTGQACAAAAECLSNFCVDGVCCSTSCLTTCQACNSAGAEGTCFNLPLGEEDLNATTTCTGVNSCNGAGSCLLDSGQPCTTDAECASNSCDPMTLMCK